ncbi:MAG: sigma-70 family RNA polymerase sigma factor [Clostridium sp.]|nr:sigma-70 family RNA polymerase sigma factor [Prevotella sp.]MCM1428415.1 sigma-70 family RNA polymerase sigma factor [Clostridium sp.]MCM1476254.1 sigma-70 family RNA polymerase sigma factor [Muribaculaceae bacterium]
MADSSIKSRLLELQGNLLNFAYQLTTSRDAAQDLVQDTALKVLDNQEKFADNTNFKGWVFTIMRNIFINSYRRQMRSTTIIDTTADLYHLNLSQESGLSTPEGSFAAHEISKAIASFPPDYRRPFSLFLAGYKYAEIAEIMHLPLGTIKSRIFFTRRRLQLILADYRFRD